MTRPSTGGDGVEQLLREVFAEQATHARGVIEPVDVQRRARGVRRRQRLAAAAAAAVAVVAVAVPVSVMSGDGPHRTSPGPASGPPPPSTPAPPPPDASPLDLRRLPDGPPPEVGYRVGDEVTTYGSLARVWGGARQFARIGNGLVYSADDGSGGLELRLVDLATAVDTVASPLAERFVTTDWGTVYWAEPDGAVHVYSDGDDAPSEIGHVPGATVVGISPECDGTAWQDGCAVYLRAGADRTLVVVDEEHPDGYRPTSALTSLWSASPSGLSTGLTEDGTEAEPCWAVVRGVEDVVTRSCEEGFDSVSPDGGRVVTTAASPDGAGHRWLGLLDLESGGQVAWRLRDAGLSFTTVAWEDDGRDLLAVVWDMERGASAVVRLRSDGSAELALVADAGTEVGVEERR